MLDVRRHRRGMPPHLSARLLSLRCYSFTATASQPRPLLAHVEFRGQEWCQVEEKDVPPEIPLTEALVVPELVTIVIEVGFDAPSDPPFTFAPVNVTVPKFARGSTPLDEDGASAMTSAEDRASEELVWLTVWLQPRVVSAR